VARLHLYNSFVGMRCVSCSVHKGQIQFGNYPFSGNALDIEKIHSCVLRLQYTETLICTRRATRLCVDTKILATMLLRRKIQTKERIAICYHNYGPYVTLFKFIVFCACAQGASSLLLQNSVSFARAAVAADLEGPTPGGGGRSFSDTNSRT
jgi:hypothetical protein